MLLVYILTAHLALFFAFLPVPCAIELDKLCPALASIGASVSGVPRGGAQGAEAPPSALAQQPVQLTNIVTDN